MPGQFVLENIVHLGAALWTADEAMGAWRRATREKQRDLVDE